jgi:hypothetical protein
MRMLLLALVIAACGKSEPEPAKKAEPAKTDSKFHTESLAKIEGFADKICACTTKACAKQVNDELDAWTRQTAAQTADPGVASDETQAKVNDALNKFTGCLTKSLRLPE